MDAARIQGPLKCHLVGKKSLYTKEKCERHISQSVNGRADNLFEQLV